MAPLVLFAVVAAVPQGSFAQRDDGLDPVLGQTLTLSVGVKGLVTNEGLARDAGQEIIDGLDVVALARQQDEAHQVSQSIDESRDLARQAAARAPNRLTESPPLAPVPS